MKDKIQTEIDIVLAMIKTYEESLTRFSDKKILSDTNKKLEKEKIKLDELKSKHSEYFI